MVSPISTKSCLVMPSVNTMGKNTHTVVDMGLTIAYSLLSSLIIALTVVPAMSSKMLVRTKEKKEGVVFGGMVKGYEKLLSRALWLPHFAHPLWIESLPQPGSSTPKSLLTLHPSGAKY